MSETEAHGEIPARPSPAKPSGQRPPSTLDTGTEGKGHSPSDLADVTGENGDPARHQCARCGQPVTYQRGTWRNVFNFSAFCPAGREEDPIIIGYPGAPGE